MMEAGIWRLIAVSLVLASCGVQGGFKPIDRGFEKVPVARYPTDLANASCR